PPACLGQRPGLQPARLAVRLGTADAAEAGEADRSSHSAGRIRDMGRAGYWRLSTSARSPQTILRARPTELSAEATTTQPTVYGCSYIAAGDASSTGSAPTA